MSEVSDSELSLVREMADRRASRIAWWWMAGLFVVLVAVLWPKLLKARKAGDHARTIGHSRHIGFALLDFETEYGAMPSAATIPEVKRRTKTPLTLGTASSNGYFRQLIAAGFAPAELIFEAKGWSPRKPDGRVDTDATALAPGECGFSYLPGSSSSGPQGRPVVLAPLRSDGRTFDTEVYGRKGTLLRADNSVGSLSLDEAGRAILEGKDLFDPAQLFWEGSIPEVKLPE